MKNSKTAILIGVSLVGFALVIYALVAALASNFLWYDFFTVGMLLLLSPISYQLRDNTLFGFTLKSPFLFLLLYLIFFFMGFSIELCGTKLADLWYYPHYSKDAQAIHSLVIGYPFAFLSLIPLYEIVEHLLFLRIKKPQSRRNQHNRPLVQILLLIIGLILVLSPIADKYLANGTYVRYLSVLAMLGGIVLVDALRGMSSNKSLIVSIWRREYRCAVVLVATAWIAALMNEVPNRVPQTWTYHNVPFTQMRLLGVNVIVFFLGWIFLTYVPVSIFRILERKSDRMIRQRHLCLERPAVSLQLPYVLFWSLIAVMLVFMRLTLLLFVGARDTYFFLTYLMALGLVWIASEIIWSYRGLLKLQEVIRMIATTSRKKEVLTWYKKRVAYIYRSYNMAAT